MSNYITLNLFKVFLRIEFGINGMLNKMSYCLDEGLSKKKYI